MKFLVEIKRIFKFKQNQQNEVKPKLDLSRDVSYKRNKQSRSSKKSKKTTDEDIKTMTRENERLERLQKVLEMSCDAIRSFNQGTFEAKMHTFVLELEPTKIKHEPKPKAAKNTSAPEELNDNSYLESVALPSFDLLNVTCDAKSPTQVNEKYRDSQTFLDSTSDEDQLENIIDDPLLQELIRDSGVDFNSIIDEENSSDASQTNCLDINLAYESSGHHLATQSNKLLYDMSNSLTNSFMPENHYDNLIDVNLIHDQFQPSNFSMAHNCENQFDAFFH